MKCIKQIGVIITCILLSSVNANAQEKYIAEEKILKIVEQDVKLCNEEMAVGSFQLEQPAEILRQGEESLAIFEEENTVEIGAADDKTVYRNERVTVYAMETGHNSRLDYVPGGSVRVAHYYTLDASNNHFQMIRSTFTYTVTASNYKFVNVKGGYGLRGSRPSGVEYFSPLTMRSFEDKAAGTITNVIDVNSPIILYNENPLKFEIATVTSFTVKNMATGQTWNQEIGFYSIDS